MSDVPRKFIDPDPSPMGQGVKTLRIEIPEELFDKCPKCGKETTIGYGLAGGGCGTYVVCAEHGIVGKTQDDED